MVGLVCKFDLDGRSHSVFRQKLDKKFYICYTYNNATYVQGRVVLDVNDVRKKVSEEFSEIYTHFKEFQYNLEYSAYWNKCMESISDRDLLTCIIFCNDTFGIPPVKTFLTHYLSDFIKITENEKAILETYIKRSIGAFWGMVFKFVLGYTEQKSVSVSMNEHFMVKTASVYSGAKTLCDIEN